MLEKKVLLYGAAVFLVLAVVASVSATAKGLPLSDARVTTALAHLETQNPYAEIIAQSVLRKAWLTSDSRGYTVNLGFEVTADQGRRAQLMVTFDQKGNVVGSNIGLWTSSRMPECLGAISVALFVSWAFVEFAVPLVFGVKCPDCTWNPLRPVLMHGVDTVVYHGGYDVNSLSLAPIVRRVHTCPVCGYQRIRHRIPENYRDSSKLFPALTGLFQPGYDPKTPLLNEREQRWYDKVVSQNRRTSAQHSKKFSTYEQWLEYYKSLKAQDCDAKGR